MKPYLKKNAAFSREDASLRAGTGFDFLGKRRPFPEKN
jgi:hypothetical protein